MSLRALAEADLQYILEDAVGGFGWAITLTDPTGFSSPEPLMGFSSDIGFVIDPETGQAVSGRTVTIALRISSIASAGYTGIPRSIENTANKPWLVSVADITGQIWNFKVSKSAPDRALGIVTCELELYG